jgi:WS/DGAT/MGAT family acyltransferase
MTMARPPAPNPLNAPIGKARRFGTAAMSLKDFKRIRRVHGGTINDVVLAVVAGALREWMMTRGESVSSRTAVRALVPVSVRVGEEGGGNHIAAFLVDLPVGEPQPVVRLHRVSYEMEQVKSTGQMVGAQALVGIAGFAPPTLHSLGARTANGLSRRMFNLVVTNVPGPQFPLYAGGALMLAAYPVVPLAKGQAVSIGLTSYDGGLYFGLNADREAMTDIDVLSECLGTALAELLDTLPGDVDHTPAAPPTHAPAVPKVRAAELAHPEDGVPEVVDAAVEPVVVVEPARPVRSPAPTDELISVRPRQVSSAPSRGLVPRGGNEIKSQPIVRRPTESDPA